jgi:folate-dependent tRNA-U54 methylase TrmFO/GidA
METITRKMEELRLEALKNKKLTPTQREYFEEHFYENVSYCEQCDTIDTDLNWFWYDGDEYTDYLHIKCNKDKYMKSKQETEINFWEEY